MFNVLKYFFVIIVSCFGLGLSVSFPELCYLVLAAIFLVLDLVGVFLVLKCSRSDLFGVFCTFCPSLVLTEIIRENVFIVGAEAETMLLSMEYSFVLVLIGLLIYSVILFLRKKKVSTRI